VATVTDSLITLLQLKGGPQYAQQMKQAAGATGALATAQKESAGAGKELASAFGLALTGAAGIAAGIGLIKKSVAAFAESEQATFRSTILLRNLGNSYPIEKAQAFASALQATTAADDEAVVGVIASLKAFGAQDNQLEGLTKTILDTSEALGLGLAETTQAVGLGALGSTRGLRQLKITMTDTHNAAKNLAIEQKKLDALYGGAAAARIKTYQGAMDRLGKSFDNVFETAGDGANVLVTAINKLADALNALSQNKFLSTTLVGAGAGAAIGGGLGLLGATPFSVGAGALGGGLIGALIGGLFGLLPGHKNAAAAIGTGNARAATEATLQKIADNTAQLSPFIRQVIGGTGEVARRSFTFRDARMSFGV
jgi:hypothetical protein